MRTQAPDEFAILAPDDEQASTPAAVTEVRLVPNDGKVTLQSRVKGSTFWYSLLSLNTSRVWGGAAELHGGLGDGAGVRTEMKVPRRLLIKGLNDGPSH